MIDTRCLPSRSFTAAENCSRLTSFSPTRKRGGLEGAGKGFDFMGLRLSHDTYDNIYYKSLNAIPSRFELIEARAVP
jgi:hypothetical protein